MAKLVKRFSWLKFPALRYNMVSIFCMYLPDVLLQQGMDDDPDQGIKDNIEDIQHTVLIIGLRKGPGVYTKATGV